MPNFEIRNIDAVNGKQKFYKLIKDGTCQIDYFENNLEEAYKPELKTIYAYMDQVANLKSLPQTKFHFYDKAKGGFREFEFKSKHLRVYGIVIDEGKLVIFNQMDRKELLKSPEYWTASIQMELYRQIEAFMKEKNFNKTQLAEYLGCSKGYITQLLSGDFDHKLSKFIQLSLSIGKIPEFCFTDIDEYIQNETQSYKNTMVLSNKCPFSTFSLSNSIIEDAA